MENTNNNYSENLIEGRNPVIEALKSGRTIDKILISKGDRNGSVKKIIAMAREKKIAISEADKAKLDKISVTHSHQGVIAYAAAGEYSSVEEIIDYARKKGELPFIIIADNITDPHNLGSIIRTANVAGAHGVIIPKRNSVGLTPVVEKSSAGALEYTKIAKVSNLASVIERLKKENIWLIAADMDGKKNIYEHDFSGAVAIVVGSEGNGISRLVKEKCDFIVNIPMFGQINSLNASVAAALMIYEVVRVRNTI